MIQSVIETRPAAQPNDPLHQAAGRLRAALAEPFAGRERDWSASVGQALLEVECELRSRCARNQEKDGPLAALDATRPTLLRQWSGLCHEYRELAERGQRLRVEASRAAEAFQPVGEALEEATAPTPVPPVSTGVPVLGSLRARAEQLLVPLEKNRVMETALVLESVTTDIGVGD
jgi:hypothetical protein